MLEVARSLPEGLSASGGRLLELDRVLAAAPGPGGGVPQLPLDLESESFDLIFSLSALRGLDASLGEWLTEMGRLLAPDGLLVMALDAEPQRRWVTLRRRPASGPPEAAELEGGLAALLAELDQRRRREVDAVRDSFQQELMRKAFRISELELGSGATPGYWANAERVAAEYEATLSWRITRPLRAAGNLLRRR